MRRRDVVNGVGAMLAVTAVLPLAPVWAARDEGEYRIVQALYGTAERHVDVTPRLRELAQRDERFRLGNDTFGLDPDRGRLKTLRIIATGPGGRQRTFEYTEGGWVDGSLFTGWAGGNWGQDTAPQGGWRNRPGFHDGGDAGYQILQALYGTAERHIDVTQSLRDIARGDDRFRLNGDSFGRDTDRGRAVKVLRIYARNGSGQYRIFEYPEGSWVDGAQFSGWNSGQWGRSGWGGGWGGERPGSSAISTSGYDEGLRIVQAQYGAGNRSIDITERLQQRVHNGRLNVKVDNATAGSDPADKWPKQLWLTYSVNGREQRRVLAEGDMLTLP